MSWSDTPVLSGVSYMWKSGRNPLTNMYGGSIYVPRGAIQQCPLCAVPHENNDRVYCTDPWHKKKGEMPPVICTDCHNELQQQPDRENLIYLNTRTGRIFNRKPRMP